MTSRKAVDSLQDILDAISAIERFTAKVDFPSFLQNEEKIFAVEKALEIIGEAVKNLPLSIRLAYPQVPWRNIAGMRDKLTHQYWRVDVEVVWKAVIKDIPQLKLTISEILEDMQPEL